MSKTVAAVEPANPVVSAWRIRLSRALRMGLAAVCTLCADVKAQSPQEEWVKDWPRFAEVAIAHLQATVVNGATNADKRGAVIVVPGAVGRRVEWVGIYSETTQRDELLGIEQDGKIEFKKASWAVARLKVFPAIRVRLKECEVVGDTLEVSISDAELPQWKRLKSGMAVRVSLELGLKNYRPGNEPSPITATIQPALRGVCPLQLMLIDPKLLEAW